MMTSNCMASYQQLGMRITLRLKEIKKVELPEIAVPKSSTEHGLFIFYLREDVAGAVK